VPASPPAPPAEEPAHRPSPPRPSPTPTPAPPPPKTPPCQHPLSPLPSPAGSSSSLYSSGVTGQGGFLGAPCGVPPTGNMSVTSSPPGAMMCDQPCAQSWRMSVRQARGETGRAGARSRYETGSNHPQAASQNHHKLTSLLNESQRTPQPTSLSDSALHNNILCDKTVLGPMLEVEHTAINLLGCS
jgi:hypothetical protein